MRIAVVGVRSSAVSVEPDLAGAARQAGEMLHSFDHPADHCDVAIKLAGGVADDGIQLPAPEPVSGGLSRPTPTVP